MKESQKMLKRIGGDWPLPAPDHFTYMTDSGRSSLRLIARSCLQGKRVLLPDFLCQSIIDVLRQERVQYGFYPVDPDLTPRVTSAALNGADVFYSIDYFGAASRVPRIVRQRGLFIIKDQTFSPFPQEPGQGVGDVCFNSFRKVCAVAEGSFILSRIPLKEKFILRGTAPFALWKYKAKECKYKFLHQGQGSETAYLKLFVKGERLLDLQRRIHSVSPRGVTLITSFLSDLEREAKARVANFKLLDRYLKDRSLGFSPSFPSFYVLNLDRRDEVRAALFRNKIFLPVHWPRQAMVKNDLYDRVLSIPVDSRFQTKDMLRVAKLLAVL